jgi:ankyrin repeat protein
MAGKTRVEMQLEIVNRNLIEAVGDSDMPKINLCLQKGADINTRNAAQQDRTPLMMAVVRGRIPLVEFLMAKGADVLAKDKTGSTVYELVASVQDWETRGKMNTLLLKALPDMQPGATSPATAAQLTETKDDITVMKPLDVSKGKNPQAPGKGFSL